MSVLNIGILAHVDAGKTSLTERLLFEAGVIDRLGSVDAGTTQTDSGAIERRRGITIKSAVAALRVGDVRVNLIDTPGHSDFVAEVERALGVLDGAVLVLSAVEGVQAHTRRLMKTLKRLGLPTLVFVNKIDRRGARDVELLADIQRLLTPDAIAVNTVEGIGTKAARVVPEDLDVEMWALLTTETAKAGAYPLFFGSAITGEGVAELIDGIKDLLPTACGRADAEVRGTVFAIERGRAGDKTAYVRIREGTLRNRDKTEHGTVTALEVVGAPQQKHAGPGDIAKIRGLAEIRVGDSFGTERKNEIHFATPSLETVVRTADGDVGDRTRLHAALVALADQDPLIRTRALPGGGTSVLLYGEVQKEVIAATLAEEFGIQAVFEPSSTVYAERPSGVGEYLEDMGHFPNTRFRATLGFRVEPAPRGTGAVFRYETELGALPPVFHRATEETVLKTLAQGLDGWEVTDVAVTMVHSGFCSVTSVAADFRKLAPYVVMQALDRAGTDVYEPCHAFELDIPTDTLPAVMAHLISHEAEIRESSGDPASWTLRGDIPARTVQDTEKSLPALTRGEAIWLSQAAGDRIARTRPPAKTRTDGNSVDLDEYLRYLSLERV